MATDDITLEVMRTGHSDENVPFHEYYLEVISGRELGQKITIVTDRPIDIKPLQRFWIVVHGDWIT